MSIARIATAASIAALLATGCAHTRPNATTPTADGTQEQPRGSAAASPHPVDPAVLAAAIEHASSAADTALEAAMHRAVGWQTLPEDLPWRDIIDPDRTPRGSMSAGTVASGVLLNAAELPFEGERYSIIERHRKHQTRFATEELVELIRHASQHVAKTEGGAPLRVGNMSRKQGGDIRWSNSHNSGRDADLAFYVVKKEDATSVPSPDLLRFVEGGAAVGRDDLVFDTPRNWRLVEALVTHPTIGVQWIFISIPLKQMLLDHARTISADPEVIRRAESALHQPTDSSPHNDHFHLRIACPKDDRLDGCLDYGPQWDWVDWHRDELLARALRLSETFDHNEAPVKTRALDYLDTIRSPFAADIATVWGVWDADPEVREHAMRVTEGQYSWSGNVLVQLFKYILSRPEGRNHLARAYAVLRRSIDPQARDFALSRIVAPDADEAERVEAVRALGHFMEPELAESLIGQLAIQPPAVRVEIAEVLRRIANRSEGLDWAKASDVEVAKALQAWRAWWSAHGSEPRERWLAAGFAAAGVDLGDPPQPKAVDGLLELLQSAPPHIVYNASRAIRELTGRWAPLEQTDGRKLHSYWQKWWKKNRTRVIERGPLGGDDSDS